MTLLPESKTTLAEMQGKYQEMYLDYVNNFLTLDAFASHYCITPSVASNIVTMGRMIQNGNLEFVSTEDDDE